MLLITPAEVVELAFTPREIISHSSVRHLKIDVAQEHFIRPRFGDALFEKFKEGEHSAFVDGFIKPALAHFVRYGLVDELSIQMSDTGAVIFHREVTQAERSSNSSTNLTEQLTAQMRDNSTVQSRTTTNSQTEKQSELQSKVDDQKNLTDITELQRDVTATASSTTQNKDLIKNDQLTQTQRNDTTSLERSISETTTSEQTTVGTDATLPQSNVINKNLTQVLQANDSTDEANESITVSNVQQTVTDNGDISKTSTLTGSDTNKMTQTQDQTQTHSAVITKNDSAKDQTTQDGTKLVEDSSNGTEDKDTKRTSQRALEDQAEQNTERMSYRPSSDLQRRLIRSRALADANILMAKAVRYVERNIELFPEYEPRSVDYGHLVL